MIKVLKQKKYYYDIFLSSLDLSGKVHVISHKIKNGLLMNHRPDTLTLGITYRCQLDCVHCGVKGYLSNNKAELTTQEIKDAINQSHRLGIYHVNFSGGEPLMRQDLEALVDFTAKKGLIVSISTNGLLLTQSKIFQLKHSGITFINISIDSVNPHIHDKLRNSIGSFQKAQDAIVSCIAEGIPVFVSTYATKENIYNGDIKLLIQYAKKIGASGVKILFSIPAGKWLKCPEVMLSEKEKRDACELIEPNYVFVEGVCNRSTECNALLRKLLYVSPYGEVQPCLFVPLSYGNIREEPLGRIWTRMMKDAIYRVSENHECIMLKAGFRERYIDSIEKDQKLPLALAPAPKDT